MGDLVIDNPQSGRIELKDALEQRYLTYALSTIMNRALPDVRDGLKPVHRRILHAMRLLKLDPGSGFKKSARVVGDVIGKYHPHGEAAVYDALVRLAQDFAVRYPLVDGQGNFGNVDGDNPAAMRYTEARMTKVASLLLDGMDQDTVDFRETYDGEDSEPIVLPGNFPNLLANGSQGIAVGMATSIPPHNAAELIDGALKLIDNPDTTVEELLEIIPGPDLPTGGIIVEPKATILETYRTGKGGFRIRARWHKEELARGAWVLVVTEIPYMVPKSRLIEKIADLLLSKKLPLLGDVRDESAEDVRIVLEPRARNVEPLMLMESLFKLTELESRVSLNMNVLVHGKVPKVLSLNEVLQHWLNHRYEVLERQSRFRLNAIEKRLEILEGYLVAYLNLDEVIRIIRESDEAKQELMSRFKLTDNQAEAILNMRLRSLRKLEEVEIRREHAALIKEKKGLESLLASPEAKWRSIGSTLKTVREEFGPDTVLGKRRTTFDKAPTASAADIVEAMIEKEPITIVLSQKGWIRALKGHMNDLSSLSFKAEDELKQAITAETTDKIMALSSAGKMFTLGADKLPGGRGHGEPLRLMIELEPDEEIVSLFTYQAKKSRLVVASNGRGFVVCEDDLIANTRKGKNLINVDSGARASCCVPAEGDMVAVCGENRKLLVFPLSQIPVMKRGAGVRLQRYKDGGMADVQVFERSKGLQWLDSSGRTWTVEMTDDWIGTRASVGRMPPKGFPRNNRFSG